MEAPPGLEPGMKVLQTSALPLGYGALNQKEILSLDAGLMHSIPPKRCLNLTNAAFTPEQFQCAILPLAMPARAGADDEARTRYLHLGKVALYQMS